MNMLRSLPRAVLILLLAAMTGWAIFHRDRVNLGQLDTLLTSLGAGVRLHYEMQQVIRKQNKKLRDFDLRAESFEAALAEIKTRFPDYTLLGTWVEAREK